jgi:hypothetical protein
MKIKKAFFKEISGELDSPLEIYLKFENSKNSYFFESVEGGENGQDILLLVCLQIRKFHYLKIL